MDQSIYRDLLSTNSRHKWICQGTVEDLLTAKVPRRIEKLSRSYWEKFQKAWLIENALTSIKKSRKRGSINTNLLRICWEVVELEENEFFKEEKHKKMNASSKLLKHRSNQHIKLSKYLSTYMQSIQDPKHTNTLNKSNEFYISKTN